MRTPGIRHAALAVAGMVLVLAGSGCFFSPRVPEPPQSGTAVDYLDQTLPENVWANLGKSLQNNDSGGWERNVGEEFTYIPDTEAETEYPDAFATPWEREQEVEFIRKFYSFGPTNSEVKMKHDGFDVPEPSGTTAYWEKVIYDLTVESGGSLTRYRGQANILFALDGTEWYVTSWEDIGGEPDPDDPGPAFATFGSLRGTTH
ncbi:MAG: hypothetical protein GY838_19250 [bacterium]|nr:hypothetical protein [bacterium]